MGNTQLAEQPRSTVPDACPATTAGDAPAHDIPALRLLIIDDEIDPDDPLIRTLAFEGVAATSAQSATEGLAYARAGEFDAILLDLKLPDMLGMSVLSLIRREGIRIPVVVFTGYFLDTDHEEKAFQIGAAAFLLKPILDAAELAATIHRVVACYVPPSDREETGPKHSPRLKSRTTSRRHVILQLVDLHARALESDASAIQEIVRLLLPDLRARLRHTFPRKAAEWIDDAVEDAILEYCADPSRYDATRGSSLDRYLEYNSSRNVLNAFDSTRRRLTHETTDIAPGFWQALRAPADPNRSERLEQLRDMMVTVRASLTPDEQVVHDLQMAEEHRTDAYARELHLEHLPWPEQVRRVRLVTNAVSHKVHRALLRLRDRLFQSHSNG